MNIQDQLHEQSDVLKEKTETAVEQVKESLENLQEKLGEQARGVQDNVQNTTTKLAADGQSLASGVQEQVGAALQDVTGHVQAVVGRITDNPALEAEGLARQAEAEIVREHVEQTDE